MDYLEFAKERRAAAVSAIADLTEEIAACDAAIAAWTTPPVVDPPAPEPEQPPVVVDPVDPPPAPPVVGGPVIKTVAELQTALANAKGGDVLPLGDLPQATLSGVAFNTPVTLHGGSIERLWLKGVSGLRIEAVHFQPSGPAIYSGGAKPFLLDADAASNDIEVVGCDFWGGADAASFWSWTLADWKQRFIGAAMLRGQRIRVANNAAMGVNFGFILAGSDVTFDDNRVCGFSADALRACASNMTGRRNWFTDAYGIDGNHPDGIQGFDHSKTLTGQVFEDTIIMEHSTPTDTRGAVGASLQLIGYHDGPYDGITYRRAVGCSSSYNAYHVDACPTHTAEQVMFWTVPGPKGGASRFRVPAVSAVKEVSMDKYVGGGAPTTGKPDYSKLAAFQVPALRGNKMPDIRAIMGW